MDTRFKNTDFFIEDIDESVKDLTVNDSSVSHLPANTDFFIENIDNNVIEICTDRGITPATVSVVPANTDFFIVNIDSNVKKIASDLSITPSSVEKVPANTDFFIENIYFNIILICEELNIEPYEITVTPTNTDFFIEAIAKNVEKIMEAQTEIHVNGTFIHAVLSADSKISDYELEGNATQDGTPTPDAPVPISTVTGEQTVTITGKNLFDKDNADTANGYLSGSTGAFVVGGGSYATKNATFLSAGDYVASQMLEKVCHYALDGSYIGLITRTGSNNEKFTMPSVGFVRLQFPSSFNADTFQLELGSTASDYQAFQSQTKTIDLDTIELAKIGTYQDRIYKDAESNKWYIEKQVGKVMLDGNTDITLFNTSNNVLGVRVPLDSSAVPSGYGVSPIISDYLQSVTFANFYSSRGYGQIASHNSETLTTLYASAPDSSVTTLAEFKTWLSTHNTTVYYALATPTTTEITDETLVGELNDIYALELKEGVINISVTATSPNLPATLKATIIPKE